MLPVALGQQARPTLLHEPLARSSAVVVASYGSLPYQGELAAAGGIGRVTLVRIENGDQSPRYETLVAVAGALRRAVAGLLEGEAAA